MKLSTILTKTVSTETKLTTGNRDRSFIRPRQKWWGFLLPSFPKMLHTDEDIKNITIFLLAA